MSLQLRSQVNTRGSAIGTLFNLHQQQQILIGQLQGAINFLFSRDASQQGQLNNLQNQSSDS